MAVNMAYDVYNYSTDNEILHIVYRLKQSFPLLDRIFTADFEFDTLSAGDLLLAEQQYSELLTDGPRPPLNTLRELFDKFQAISTNNVANVELTCFPTRRVFDVGKRAHVQYLAPQKPRGRPVEFDVYKFISEKEERNEAYRIQMELEDDGYVLDEGFLQPAIQDSQTDHNLRKIARIVTVLNRESDHPVLECHSERRIH